ncbi:hypothetical protein BCR34DRAFT_29980 [Clohesyomyces aquaticus]|uniref:Uncharacterized protein n=1 Tax=Clohesyomyces aquaticus TaxID=1231657 RepID=A0A1Y1Z9T4_9PLEO|nr:hypothetical protein BCR34DRAFT_29980 [Clohesyomyces aquaticus]
MTWSKILRCYLSGERQRRRIQTLRPAGRNSKDYLQQSTRRGEALRRSPHATRDGCMRVLNDSLCMLRCSSNTAFWSGLHFVHVCAFVHTWHARTVRCQCGWIDVSWLASLAWTRSCRPELRTPLGLPGVCFTARCCFFQARSGARECMDLSCSIPACPDHAHATRTGEGSLLVRATVTLEGLEERTCLQHGVAECCIDTTWRS